MTNKGPDHHIKEKNKENHDMARINQEIEEELMAYLKEERIERKAKKPYRWTIVIVLMIILLLYLYRATKYFLLIHILLH
ncbi:hypothetical protein [Staphylococcus lutrae]|uniref:Uncharacterized protein n=1 Tax=Staphylococcus lutrae TaxID=155085 RepID=A0AAC9WJD2_9STAP|nr:hypothetical protein [Staphylococcus lutrae]ARJ50731.1 hypothetical protein B5P37_05055 [Staphylococcus lutrae]PNZ34780.1 hypothetical protein CD134_10385 [Staphylococcus lutrae]